MGRLLRPGIDQGTAVSFNTSIHLLLASRQGCHKCAHSAATLAIGLLTIYIACLVDSNGSYCPLKVIMVRMEKYASLSSDAAHWAYFYHKSCQVRELGKQVRLPE